MILSAQSASYERVLDSQKLPGRRAAAAIFAKERLLTELPGYVTAETASTARPASSMGTNADGDQLLRRAERSWLARQFHLTPEQVVLLKQVHGRHVVHITAERLAGASTSSGVYLAEGDALFTDLPDVLLTIRTADCLPLFFDLYTPDCTIVGLVHAGWRGLAAEIVEQALKQALTALAPDGRSETEIPIRGSIFMGPCIGAAVYEVGADVADHFPVKQECSPSPAGGDPCVHMEPKYLLDLVGNARLQVDRALSDFAARNGRVLEAFRSGFQFRDDFAGCTYSANDRYFSHRRGDSGRNLNAIMIASE